MCRRDELRVFSNSFSDEIEKIVSPPVWVVFGHLPEEGIVDYGQPLAG